MNKFLVDRNGTIFHYDMESDNKNVNTWYSVIFNNEKTYIRPHREDGPAIIWPNDKLEFLEYYVCGLHHRVDGPAIIYGDGVVEWWLNDVCYSFEDWCSELKKSSEEINELKIKYNV